MASVLCCSSASTPRRNVRSSAGTRPKARRARAEISLPLGHTAARRPAEPAQAIFAGTT
jgi:hypothetical protein